MIRKLIQALELSFWLSLAIMLISYALVGTFVPR